MLSADGGVKHGTGVEVTRTQVAIVGAGPAGLVLAHLLGRCGVESVVLEARSRHHVEHRVRAGVLEYPTVQLLGETGVGERLRREGLEHGGISLRFDRADHRIDFAALTGRSITVYGQQEVVRDLIAARLAAGGEILFGVDGVRLSGLDTDQPEVAFTDGDGVERVLRAAVVAGCDGFHGVCRPAVPPGALRVFERDYPFAWLGILAKAAPAQAEVTYAHGEGGFALASMRSPEVTRLYLQVAPDEDVAAWPDDRIWAELDARLAVDGGHALNEGPILERGLTAMRSFVVEPMRHGRLFLAGDAAHIVPPTGAKGMNLAVADVAVLAEALERFFATGRGDLLDGYSERCLRRVWRAEHFSWWMTSMLHLAPGADPFERRLQLSQLRYLTSSPAAATSLAENYVGLPYGS
ncbi:MAG TPA: 4-hydroxybenzoate 3-monooxygenase [Acidimicrobiia bacterium]|nr:4-hydroxybenzoate 3-monooxygenase [Acidimicrobiia bacterium]